MDAGDPRHNPDITGSDEDTYGSAKEERESGAKHGQGHYAQAPPDEADSNEVAKPDPPPPQAASPKWDVLGAPWHGGQLAQWEVAGALMTP